MSVVAEDHVRWLSDLTNQDVAVVGGKNASLGEMIRALSSKGVRVPDGFATTASAWRRFLAENGLEERIRELLASREQGAALPEVGARIRAALLVGRFPDAFAAEIRRAYAELSARYGEEAVDVAVRSSATAEDLPEASFAGQQETFLNIRGAEALLDACRRCFASLYTDRAIVYRDLHGIDHLRVALSVGVQKMVRSDLAGAGVAFTLDTETGFPRIVLVTAAWGLGEAVVQGAVEPDEYRVFRPFLDREGAQPILERTLGAKRKKIVYAVGDPPTREVETTEDERRRWVLTDAEIVELARWCVAIEEHYGRPMDVEWAKDGPDGPLTIVQARPETVEARRTEPGLTTWRLLEEGERLVSGLAIGQGIGVGPVCRISDVSQMDRFVDGAVLVAPNTDPDWVPVMKRASAIVTDHGGRTSHAAIVSRELGVPAIVGAVDATARLTDGEEVTVSCAEGEEGHVYRGRLRFEAQELDIGALPDVSTQILVNVGNPAAAMRWWRLPVRGIGLARMEYVVNHVIGVHPMALVRPDALDEPTRRAVAERTRGFDDPREYFVHHLAHAIATMAASRHPDPVVVRTSDFKTNEYAHLLGGEAFEPREDDPMLGWRGASRYTDPDYRDGFALECAALRRVRGWGYDNVVVMIPFCRTLEEADRVLEVMAAHGLRRGEGGLRVFVMAEIPSNVLLARDFARRFDGFSIGSNDLTQLVLGVARGSEKLRHLFDEANPAVKRAIRMLVEEAHAEGVPVGLCGQAPSDRPEFAAFLVEAGLDSMSVDPHSVVEVWRHVAEAEARMTRQRR